MRRGFFLYATVAGIGSKFGPNPQYHTGQAGPHSLKLNHNLMHSQK